MEEVIQRGNAKAALKRVKQNKGSPGVDGMTMDELPGYLAEHWETIREELLAGTYQSKPVKRQEIPKSGGGVRELGIPTTTRDAGGGSRGTKPSRSHCPRATTTGWGTQAC